MRAAYIQQCKCVCVADCCRTEYEDVTDEEATSKAQAEADAAAKEKVCSSHRIHSEIKDSSINSKAPPQLHVPEVC